MSRNNVTRRITTSVHVVFQKDNPSFTALTPIDSAMSDTSDTVSHHDHSPQSHPLDTRDADDTSDLHDAARPHRLRYHPIRYGELVAHMSDYPRVRVTACSDPEQRKPVRRKRTLSISRTWQGWLLAPHISQPAHRTSTMPYSPPETVSSRRRTVPPSPLRKRRNGNMSIALSLTTARGN
jgi:hypothetical protein